MEGNTEPDDSTREAELAEAGKSHSADRSPTPKEEAAADRERAELDADRKDVAEHYEEMSELGAHIKGEGEIK
jgi:hypothetical protein